MSDTRRSRRTPARTEKSLWSYIAAGVSAGVMLVVVGIAALVIVVPWVTGSVPLTVLTQSMAPGLPPGTLVIVQPTDPSDIRIGDVITYQLHPGKPELVTHRVVAITQSTAGDTTFTTQGDNNGAPDEAPVIPEQIKGRVWYSLPWIGYINSAVGGGGSWLVIGGAVILLAYAGWMLIGGLFTTKGKSRRRDAASEAETSPGAAAESPVETR